MPEPVRLLDCLPLSGITDYWLNFLSIPADGEVPGRCRQSAVWRVGGGVGSEGGSPGPGSIRHVSRPDANSTGAPLLYDRSSALHAEDAYSAAAEYQSPVERWQPAEPHENPHFATLDAHSFGPIWADLGQ